MAPRESSSGASTRGRGPRKDRGDRAAGGRRPAGGPGGIRKKFVKVDADGDATMGDGATGSGARGRGGRGDRRGGRGGRGTDSARGEKFARGIRGGQANVLASRITEKKDEDYGAFVRVLGLKESKAFKTNSDGGLKTLIEFIQRKASKFPPESSSPIKVKQSRNDGDWVILTASQEDAAKILMLNGFSFAGQKLTIQSMEPGVEYKEEKKKELSESAQETLAKIRSVLEERYVADGLLLNLAALGQDEKLVKMGFFDDTHTVGKLFPVMMVCCNDIFTDAAKKVEYVSSISLASNALSNVSLVNDLAETFPDLQNLDLSFNQIQDLRGLDAWRHKFRKLERLSLNGNPIIDIPSDYKEKLMEWYPRLHLLNNVQVRTEGEVALAIDQAKMAENLIPIPIGDWDFRDVSNVALEFLPEFIALYDSDRNALADKFYDDQSVHSISVNARSPRQAEQQKDAVAPWDAYLPKSRNLARITHLPARMSRSHKGTAAIKTFWSSLPASKHPDLVTEKNKWVVDCHTLPGLPVPDPANAASNPHGVDGLIISLHGEFEETDPSDSNQKHLRSFSRTFILGPGRVNGIRVISDMIVYRSHNILPSLSVPVPAAPQQPASADELLKMQELAQRLSQHTLMTPQSAEICLRESNWDLEAAYSYFNAHKHEIPPEGWINGIVPMV